MEVDNMKISMTVECECGNYDSLVVKRTTNEIPDTGRVYEDYSSITDSKFKNGLFTSGQSQPDEITITCNECGKNHILTT